MQRFSRFRPAPFVMALGLVACFSDRANLANLFAAEPKQAKAADEKAGAPDTSTEIDQQRQAAERFLLVLEKSPRRGTALDRVYGYYVESGKLDDLVARYEKRVVDEPNSAVAAMVLGLLQSKRGQDATAIEAFTKAESLDKANPLAPFYLGQSYLLVGKTDQAAEAFERALLRKPPRADLLEIYQALGRLQQRANRVKEALNTWSRLEKEFPNDLRIQEQIAAALSEDNQSEEALKRYELLADKNKDLYRQVIYRIEAGNLKLRLGRKQDAVADFEKLLARLKPDSWLFDQVRQRIEAAFRREEDFAGLSEYYQGWLKKHGDDLDAMGRLARVYSTEGRGEEAREWLQKSIALAPKRSDLRLTLIDQLVQESKFGEAATQYAELDKIDKNNPDYIRQWGLLILRDKSRDQQEGRQEAAKVWKRLIAARPGDALVTSQVADLLREAGLTDDAIGLYQKAIQLKPDDPQYREYLGQYYHVLGRKDEALSTWRQIVGKRPTAESLKRLLELLSGFGYSSDALEISAQVCQLDPEDFAANLKYADLLFQAQRYPDTRTQLDKVSPLAENSEQREAVLERQVQNYQASDSLGEQIQRLAAQLKADTTAGAEAWVRLARYHEAAHQMPQAVAAIGKATARDEKSILAWRQAARIHEAAGNLVEAIAALRRLAGLDRSFRTQYLTSIAQMEARLGRSDAALQAGHDLIAAAPGNADSYQTFADLCFQLGRTDEGLDALRRAVRANPNELGHLTALAEALARQFKTSEAIEVYWQALSKSDDVETKIATTTRLAELHLQSSQFDHLIERLERLRRQSDTARAP